MRSERRFSQAISEGDGISVIVDVGDPEAARAAAAQGAEAIAVRVPLGEVEPTVVADRLFIAPVASGQGPDLAFGAVLLERGIDLGNELQGAGRSWSPPT